MQRWNCQGKQKKRKKNKENERMTKNIEKHLLTKDFTQLNQAKRQLWPA